MLDHWIHLIFLSKTRNLSITHCQRFEENLLARAGLRCSFFRLDGNGLSVRTALKMGQVEEENMGTLSFIDPGKSGGWPPIVEQTRAAIRMCAHLCDALRCSARTKSTSSLWVLQWRALTLHSQRKKLAQRRSRISQSIRDRELKLTLRVPVYNRSNSEGV